MRFQKTTEYAIRVMVYLAEKRPERLSARALYEALDIPYKYLGRLMSRLAEAGLLSVEKGKYGGYQVDRPLEEIFLYQIADVVEGLEDYRRCVLGFPECSDENPCALHSIWVVQRDQIKDMLFSTSLADLMKRPAEE